LGGLPAETVSRMRRIAWALATSFVAVTALTWSYGFTIPLVFSALITVSLIAGAALLPKQVSTPPLR
jgi:hypothetical protein